MLAAAVAYYAALSVFPLLLVLVAGLGMFLERTAAGKDAQQQVVAAIGDRTSDELAGQVQAAMDQVQDKKAVGGPLGIAGLIFGALVIFAQFDRAFSRIWNLPHPKPEGILAGLKTLLFQRLRAFVMLSVLGLLLVVIFLAGVVLTSLQQFTDGLLPYNNTLFWWLHVAVSIALNALVLAGMYRWLPKATVHWREALRGGLLAALIWEVGRVALATLVIGDRFSSAYGLIGAFIAVLLWIYYAVAVVFYGAEYVQVICQDCENADA